MKYRFSDSLDHDESGTPFKHFKKSEEGVRKTINIEKDEEIMVTEENETVVDIEKKRKKQNNEALFLKYYDPADRNDSNYEEFNAKKKKKA